MLGISHKYLQISKKYKLQAWEPSFGWKLTYLYKTHTHTSWFPDLNCKQIGPEDYFMIGHTKKTYKKRLLLYKYR